MNKAQSKALFKVLGIILAWFSLPILGLLLLFITTQSSTIQQSLLVIGKDSDIGLLTLNALLGIILILLIIILTSRVRRISYFFHLRIGFFIGLGIYGIMLIAGLAINITQKVTLDDPNSCSTPRQQYFAHSAAIVPIETDLGTGTGFAVNSNTTILTANHVIKEASSITANYSTGDVKMTILETAPQYDLALLAVDKPIDAFFRLSESYSTTDEVYAYGYPSSSLTAGPPSLSAGIISRVVDLASLRMTAQDVADGLEVIQTDAAINPGSSGGPLIGKCGVVGIISFISDTNQLHEYLGSVSEQNIGFAISSKTAMTAFPQLK
jgi:S1-C subfamily serine protease